jgi:hypothetical protein
MDGRRRFLLLIAAFALLLAAGCQAEETPEQTEPADAAEPAEPAVDAEDCQLGEDAVRIGVQGAMSGAHADYGRQMEMGSTLAAEEINADEGILGCPVELDFRDTELNPDVAIPTPATSSTSSTRTSCSASTPAASRWRWRRSCPSWTGS